MKLEINASPAVYVYGFYWAMMLLLALSPFFWEQETSQMMALSLPLGALILMLAYRVKQRFKDIKSVSINLSPTEFIGGLVIILSAIAAGINIAA